MWDEPRNPSGSLSPEGDFALLGGALAPPLTRHFIPPKTRLPHLLQPGTWVTSRSLLMLVRRHHHARALLHLVCRRHANVIRPVAREMENVSRMKILVHDRGRISLSYHHHLRRWQLVLLAEAEPMHRPI